MIAPETPVALETALGGRTVFLTAAEIEALCLYAALSTATLVEIGAGFGGSTICLLLNALDLFVFSIDPFVVNPGGWQASFRVTSAAVLQALETYGVPEAARRWRLLPRRSETVALVWKAPIGLLFVDGDHDYGAVRRDIELWSPFLITGGFLLLHDSNRPEGAPEGEFLNGWPGPTQVARELRDDPSLILIEKVDSLTVWKTN